MSTRRGGTIRGLHKVVPARLSCRVGVGFRLGLGLVLVVFGAGIRHASRRVKNNCGQWNILDVPCGPCMAGVHAVPGCAVWQVSNKEYRHQHLQSFGIGVVCRLLVLALVFAPVPVPVPAFRSLHRGKSRGACIRTLHVDVVAVVVVVVDLPNTVLHDTAK